MKNKYAIKSVHTLLESKIFKAIVFLTIIMSLFVVYNYRNYPIIDSISYVLSDHIFLSLCFLPLMLFLNSYVYDSFVKDIFAITRFENRKKYLNQLLKTVFLTTTIIFLVIFVVILIMENLLNFNGYSISFDKMRHSWNLVYMFFVIIKLYFLNVILSFVNVLLIQRINNKVIIFLNFIFFATVFYSGHNIVEVNTFSTMSFYIGNYFVNNMLYSSFLLDLLTNAIMIVAMITVLLGLYFIAKKRKMDVS